MTGQKDVPTENHSPKPAILPKATAAAASNKIPVETPEITFGAFSPFH
ncbi:MAG TPA: hypothetical protein VFR24_17270 [Candidatus Angelobacter sp.]|nr:hypothetical protein [Candidatus Angelobacter sp.]